ncbi:PAP2 superfamily protein [Prosthecobacter debontii]|uniref:PAP2 superfamily protein n=2 Tax=Prosthecobacter debontii TaxID=48467 RepID=A0A1T4YXF3_9BACT|nr:PAP2 superfamily protein [Prosthecobacter debontii]
MPDQLPMVLSSLSQTLGHLTLPAQRRHLWQVFRYHLIIRPLGRVLQLWRDARVLSLEMVHMISRNRVLALSGIALGVLICVALISPLDQACLETLSVFRRQKGWVYHTAKALSHWGDFLGFNLLVLLGLFSMSLLLRSRFLRLVVVASILGATFTGGTANLCRVMLGRARPCAKVAPGFYGPSLQSQLHACPSGHTATAFGGSLPVAVAFPPAGVPLVMVAGGIAWSRMQNNAHHPTDIWLSILLATLYGIPLGLLARRMRRHRSLRLQKYAALKSSRPAQAEVIPIKA